LSRHFFEIEPWGKAPDNSIKQQNLHPNRISRKLIQHRHPTFTHTKRTQGNKKKQERNGEKKRKKSQKAKEENRNIYALLKIVEPSSGSSMKTGLDSV
jgi:hypothetical protein